MGYGPYLANIRKYTAGKKVLSSGMGAEVKRCRMALSEACEGKIVSVVSSGDPGIYGMAGLILQIADAEGSKVPVEIIPGVTAMSGAAARLGAPLMVDFAVVSLSDILVPWKEIRKRLESAAKGDFVTVLYNPRSKRRIRQLEEVVRIFRKYRDSGTAVGIATSVGSKDERISFATLGTLLEQDIGMRSLVIIGNSRCRIMDKWMIVERGYRL